MIALRDFVQGSIQRRLSIQLASFNALVMFILTLCVSLLVQQALVEKSNKNLTNRAEGAISLLEQRFAYLQENTELLTSNHFIIDSFIDPEKREMDLPKLAENFSKGRDVKSFGIVDFDGKALFEFGLRLPLYNEMVQMREALATSKLSMFVTQGNLTFVAPIEYYQTTQGAVVVIFDLDAIAKRHAPPEEEGYLAIRKHTESLINIGQDPGKKYFSVSIVPGERYSRLNALGLHIEVGELTAITNKAIQTIMLQVLLVALFIILLAVYTSVFISKNLSNPILKLADRVQKSMSNPSIKCSPLGTRDELDILANSFDLKTQALEAYQADLENLVNRRTEDLVVANNALESSLDEVRETQNKLVESEKMAALGSLVSGVSHEINTPLGVSISANSHLNTENQKILALIADNKLKKSDLMQFLELVMKSSNIMEINLKRSAELIKNFKQVAVDQSIEELRELNLSEYTEEVLSSLKPKWKHTKVKVVTTLPADILIKTYPGPIAQIYTNLVTNAILHAFNGGQQEGLITIELKKDRSKVVINISDNGRGMDSNVLNQIFDPFFTTKRGTGGTGLGMHIVYNIVSQKLNGKIFCSSEIGKGTLFTIELPEDVGA